MRLSERVRSSGGYPFFRRRRLQNNLKYAGKERFAAAYAVVRQHYVLGGRRDSHINGAGSAAGFAEFARLSRERIFGGGRLLSGASHI